MKSPFLTLALLFLLNCTVYAQNDPAWDYLPMPHQPSVYLRIKLGKQHKNFMGTQAYIASITNVSTKKVHVSGTLTAYLTCGNQTSSSFDLTLGPGETAGGGNAVLLNDDGLGGHAEASECAGIKKYPDPNNKDNWYLDRIRTVGISLSAVTQIKDDIAADNGGAGNSNGSTGGNNAGSGYSAPAKPAATAGYTPAQQQTQAYLNSSENSSADAMSRSLALNSARINAMRQGGGTYEQRQQIQQQQAQQTQDNNNAIVSGVGQMVQILNDYASKKAQAEQDRQDRQAKAEQEERDQERQDRLDELEQQQQTNAAVMNYYNNGLQQNSQGKFDEAIGNFTNAANMTPDVSIIYYHRAKAYLGAKKFTEAKADCDKAIQLYADSADYYLLRGYISYTNLNDNSGAMADLTRANQLSPNNTMILNLKNDVDKAFRADDYMNKTQAAAQALHFEEALTDVSAAIELRPDQYRPYFIRGALEFNLRQYSAAVKDMTNALSITPNDYDALEGRSYFYNEMGEYQLAINDINTAMATLSNAKTIGELKAARAGCEYFLHRYQKVIEDCNAAISLDPVSDYAYYIRAKTYLKKLNNKDAATLDFNQVLKLDSVKTSSWVVFSQFYTGHSSDAVKTMQTQMANAKFQYEISELNYDMACLDAQMGNRTEAMQFLKKAIAAGFAKKYAMQDDDLDNLKKMPGYLSLVGSSTKRR